MSDKNGGADIVLIRPNCKAQLYYGIKPTDTGVDPPYWLALMGGWLRDEGLNVAVIDAEAAGYTHEETADIVRGLKPKLVGVLTLGDNITASTWIMPGAGMLCRTIKETVPGIPVFLWGNHPSALPERTLREEAIDYVVLGEGFPTVKALLHHYSKGTPAKENIKGVHYLENGKFCGNPELQLIHDMDSLPVDGWDLMPSNQRHYRNHIQFAFEDLSKRDRYGALMFSRGCPFGCTYCALKTFLGNDQRVRFKSIDAALKEVDYWVKERNVYYLRIIDECFTLNRKYAMEFSQRLKERGYDLSIWINARIDTVDEELLLTMREAGIKWMGYGIESSCTHIRENVGKEQYDYEKTRDIVNLTHNSDMSICSNIMFGLPGEKKEDMEADLEMIRDLNMEFPNMYCTMAYPGSRLYAETLAKHPEWLPESWEGYAQLAYKTQPLPTGYLSSAEVLGFRDYAFHAFFENNPRYFKMIERKFGHGPVEAIHSILKSRLKRKLLGD